MSTTLRRESQGDLQLTDFGADLVSPFGEDGSDAGDDEVDNLDLDTLIQSEFNNNSSEKVGHSSYELFGNALNFYKQQSSAGAGSPSSSLKAAAAYQDDQSTSSSGFSAICEDDLVDQRAVLRQMFVKDFFGKYECTCDVPMGQFVTKRSKLSKSLQRKLANLYQLLHQPSQDTCTSDTCTGGGQVDQVAIERLLAQSHDMIAALQQNSSTGETGETSAIYKIIQNQEYKKKLFRSMRSIAERICIDALALCDQYHSQQQQQEQMNSAATPTGGQAVPAAINYTNPTTKLWSEVRSRGCQFLGPQMQDDVLRLILLALEVLTRVSRKTLVYYVVYMLKKHYAKASKTSVGHVVQLLYRAGCFKVEKRENESSRMELKKEFSKYAPLRRQHDSQIIQIALDAGIRMSPEQWSQKLFGDATHKSEMQSIIDKLHSQQTLEKLAADFYEKLTTAAASANAGVFLRVKSDFDFLASVNFEKKAPAPEKAAASKPLSGGESVASDTESAEDDDFFDLQSNDELKSHKAQQLQADQTKIVWPLLVESMHKAINILSAYVEYSAKMTAIIIANQSTNFINGSAMSSSSSSLNSVQNNSNKAPLMSMRGPSFVPQPPRAYQNYKPNYLKQEQQPFSTKFKPSQQSGVADDFFADNSAAGGSFDNPRLYNNRSSDKVVMHALIQQMGPNSKPNATSYYNNNSRNHQQFNNQYVPKQQQQYGKRATNNGGFGGGGNYSGANYFNSYQNTGGGFNAKFPGDANNNLFGASNSFLDFQDMQKSLFEGTNSLGMMMPPPPSSQSGYNAFGDTASLLFDAPHALNNAGGK